MRSERKGKEGGDPSPTYLTKTKDLDTTKKREPESQTEIKYR